VNAAWANPNECAGQLEAKQVNILCAATEKRSSMFPNYSTVK